MIKIKINGNLLNDVAGIVKKQENKIIKSLINKLKEATPVDTGNARDHWEFKDGEIINTVEYIDKLNQGSSSQAPAYFIEKTLLSHPGVKPNGTIVRSE
jgi:hypothetical protein